jgi:hypothetical protein
VLRDLGMGLKGFFGDFFWDFPGRSLNQPLVTALARGYGFFSLFGIFYVKKKFCLFS